MSQNSVNILRFEIATILVGLAITTLVAQVAAIIYQPDGKINVEFITLLSIYFFLNLVNFYHAKTATALEERYNKIVAQFYHLGLFETYLVILLWSCFIAQAYHIGDIEIFMYLTIAIRIVDSSLVIFDICIDKALLKQHQPHSHQRFYWISYNIITSAISFYAILQIKSQNQTHVKIICYILVISVLVDLVIDYLIGQNLYAMKGSRERMEDFASSWNTVASEFSEKNGVSGDSIRADIFELIVKKEPENVSTPAPRLIDIGCGNGVICRKFAAIGYECDGFDISPTMIEYARNQTSLILSQNINYDVKSVYEEIPEEYDVAVCLYTLQDVKDLELALKTISNCLKPDARFYFLFETFSHLVDNEKASSLPKKIKDVTQHHYELEVSWKSGTTTTFARKHDFLVSEINKSGLEIEDCTFLHFESGFPKRVLYSGFRKKEISE